MPTENRSSKTEQMVSVPRSAADVALKLIARNLETLANDSARRRNEEAGLAFRSALLAQAADQHQGEPVAVLYADGFVMTKAECGDAFETCCKVETALYSHPPTSDGFSAGDMADQGAKVFAARDPEVEQQRIPLADQKRRYDGLHRDMEAIAARQTPRSMPVAEFAAAAIAEALSASVEPSEPVESDQGIPGTSFQRLNMLANQGE